MPAPSGVAWLVPANPVVAPVFALSVGFPLELAVVPWKKVSVSGFSRPSAVGPRLLWPFTPFSPGYSFAPPMVIVDFEVPGLPTVNRFGPAFPAAKKIAMSGWLQTNRSTIIAWRAYPIPAKRPQVKLMLETFVHAVVNSAL